MRKLVWILLGALFFGGCVSEQKPRAVYYPEFNNNHNNPKVNVPDNWPWKDSRIRRYTIPNPDGEGYIRIVTPEQVSDPYYRN